MARRQLVFRKCPVFVDFLAAVGQTLLHEAGRLAFGFLMVSARRALSIPSPRMAVRGKTIDGALLEGPRSNEYAKFTSRKGLPIGKVGRTMALEGDPHSVDDFNGVIKEGYGKGIKKLMHSGNAIIKIGPRVLIGRVNIHRHDADRAGRHWDIVAEGIPPGTKEFDLNVPNGPLKGRYAFRQVFENGQYLIVRQQDNSVRIDKPDIHLKPEEFLKGVAVKDNSVEWKADGSLANALINGNKAVFRSHRDVAGAEPYYDKLPLLEDVSNHSPIWVLRRLVPGPALDKTVLRGELFHPDGASRVGGILNALPDKSIAIQRERGPVSFYVWDIAKLRGKDVSNLPYRQRRELYEDAVRDIRLFNRAYAVVPKASLDDSALEFYHAITEDRKGLPWSEGVVVKSLDSVDGWTKVKSRDTLDLRVVEFVPGAGKFAGSLGALVVESPTGARSEVGSLQVTDGQRQWIWDNRDVLKGQIAEIKAMEITKAGAVRAGIFVRWHPSKSEAGLLMYSEGLAGSTDRKESQPMMYRLKSSTGWKR